MLLTPGAISVNYFLWYLSNATLLALELFSYYFDDRLSNPTEQLISELVIGHHCRAIGSLWGRDYQECDRALLATSLSFNNLDDRTIAFVNCFRHQYFCSLL
jgi:hypothetical protein